VKVFMCEPPLRRIGDVTGVAEVANGYRAVRTQCFQGVRYNEPDLYI
jgi:hypothetical protein